MIMVEVFKTNIREVNEAANMLQMLLGYFPGYLINFDLEDCDRILRIEYDHVVSGEIIHLLNSHGYQCEVLA